MHTNPDDSRPLVSVSQVISVVFTYRPRRYPSRSSSFIRWVRVVSYVIQSVGSTHYQQINLAYILIANTIVEGVKHCNCHSDGQKLATITTIFRRFRHRSIDRQASNSLQRSTAGAADTSPAGETQVPDSVRDVISSPGRSLNPSIQRAMEDRMGDFLGDVRIHTGPKAAQACEQINARAFTVGNHVAFNSGEYDPESPEGQHVLGNDPAPEMTDVQGKNQIAAKVEALAENQQKLFTEVKNTGQSTAEKVGAETGKGTLAATGGLVGTALMGPGVGTQAMTNAAESASDFLTVIDQRIKDAMERYIGEDTVSDNSTGDAQSRR